MRPADIGDLPESTKLLRIFPVHSPVHFGCIDYVPERKFSFRNWKVARFCPDAPLGGQNEKS
jgi:hypothetical protein